MKDKLADLVLPDMTPVEALDMDDEPKAPNSRVRRNWRLQGRWRTNMSHRTSGDWLLAMCGIGLAVVCAVFPWYIFFNQEQFGIRPLKFAGREASAGSAATLQPQLTGARIPLGMAPEQIDFIPTGTIGATSFEEGGPVTQPFPGDVVAFQLIHAAAGRAMIEDQDGFWIVERGSPLPDGSRVASIEKRNEGWVLTTTRNAEIALGQP